MGRRSLMLCEILLLCVFIASCSKRRPENSDKLIYKDFDVDIAEERKGKDDDMSENEDPNKDRLTSNRQDSEVNGYGIDKQDPDDISHVKESKDSDTDKYKESRQESDTDSHNDYIYNTGDSMTASLIESNNTINVSEDTTTLPVDLLPAGSIINTNGLNQEVLDSLFYIKELDKELIDRITGKSYKEDADIPYSDLRYIRLLHIGFDGLTHVGELIVNKAIADDLVDIFKELYAIGYPIEKMLLVDEYDADDNKSMEDNNTSCFNYRSVPGTDRRSVHSDGRAIDINPLYNPYIRTIDGKTEILPENGKEYADRDKDNPYYIRKDDPCYKAFVSRGFTWGGEWKNSKDYQHFEKKASD